MFISIQIYEMSNIAFLFRWLHIVKKVQDNFKKERIKREAAKHKGKATRHPVTYKSFVTNKKQPQ